jgi:hypothetical protein
MEESKSNVFVEILSALWEVWKEMFSALLSILPKFLGFALWALCGLLILPCVFIAGSLYPTWVEWGEDF